MGGMGSGDWFRWNSRATTESQLRVDIRWLKRRRYLIPGAIGSISWSRGYEQTWSVNFRVEHNQLVLSYRHKADDGEWEPVEQVIWFDRTLCNYGGHRLWFWCPHCRRRVAILYATSKFFLCRHCYGLAYTSQQLSPSDRLMAKARKIRQRMGGSDDLSERFPDKPKGMHWRTYWKLHGKAEQAEEMAWMLMGQRLGLSS